MKDKRKKMPLQLIFLWHRSDEVVAKPLAEYCFAMFSRDKEYPFSYSMNLPVFMARSLDYEVPLIPPFDTENTLIFPFLSANVAADDKWVDWLRDHVFVGQMGVEAIPIALDQDALYLNDDFGGINFIRSYEFEISMRMDWVFVAVANEVFRRVLSSDSLHDMLSLKIFLSHRKQDSTGLNVAIAIKNFIDSKTTLQKFFDATSIEPGDDFAAIIERNVNDSSLLAIQSDGYSSSYWCQKEILLAKKKSVPIILLDVLECGEDRSFPFLANVPTIRLSQPLEEKNILHILARILLETLRFRYVKYLFDVLSSWRGIKDCTFYSRVPELPEIAEEKKNIDGNVTKMDSSIYYGGTLIYPDEREVLNMFSNVHVKTFEYMDIDLRGKKIGISISGPSLLNQTKMGLSSKHFKLLAQDMARTFLRQNATLIYGGDLRQDGFTEHLFEEARIVQDRLKEKSCYVENYIAWPIYLKDEDETKRWKVRYHTIAKMHHVEPAEDCLDLILNPTVFLEPETEANRYVWSRCLTKMREEMIEKCDARICVGGRCAGYSGRMPGILEEILVAIKKEKPIFLLGGFGGISECICSKIENGKAVSFPNELTDSWQEKHTPGYSDLKAYYAKKNMDFHGYENVTVDLDITFDNLRNGLTEAENRRLFRTRYVEEAFYLIEKGMKKLWA